MNNDQPDPKPTSLLTHPKYRPDIDGLRAVAVLSVVVFHAFPSVLKGGFIGVDIFFVISGFLISTIIFENLGRGSFSFTEFYIRRINRIFPALLVVLASFYILGWYKLFPDEFQLLSKHIAAGAGFISNLVLWSESGYFDTTADTKPLLHLWSLGIEEQFYIVWPLLLWLAFKRNYNLLIITISVAAFSFALNIYQTSNDIVAAFYSPLTRFWELLLGACLAYAVLFKAEALQQIKLSNHGFLSLIGVALIAIGLTVISKERAFPGWWALLPTLGAVLIISAGPRAWINRRVLANRVLVWFGLISYPLYLWHWPLLSFARISDGGVPQLEKRMAAVASSILLAWLTYRFIEKPIRFGNKRYWTPLLIGLLLIVAMVGLICMQLDSVSTKKGSAFERAFIYKTRNLGYLDCEDKVLLGRTGLNYCLIGRAGLVNAALIGDSHAEDKFHGLVKIDTARNWMLIGNSSCPPVLGIAVESDQKNCQEKVENTLKWLVKKNEIKTVAISFLSSYPLTTAYAADHVKNKLGPDSIEMSSSIVPGLTREQLFLFGLDATVEKLLAADKKIIIFTDIPELPFFPRECIKKDIECTVPLQEVSSRQALHRKLLKRIQEKYPTVLIYDPSSLFCDKEKCNFKRDGVILYRDSHHLTLVGSDRYAEKFVRFINQQ